ncbi:cation-translocating P-type ATPase [Gluconacetobacter azotocaptans]|uniref:Cation-translocating P-type ATPase n=1 Tax=Gluconacetobacter azotocaptans TaxID=142834 RepID=A0A7W4JSS9_9PROT|nr:HAD-IC family P-type ATPase [Gluconacetobacter azotocaptans]MBB2190234.1 cation-translocating P-type ATPase [Gluconacetobacter azotocaptans]GBQ35877.1 cation transport ATPase [Gluconacetobacter azotocaptans DSM 13594]
MDAFSEGRGLAGSEAALRLKQDGPNELPHAGHRTAWRIVREVLKEPMFLMLLAAGGIYLLLGERGEALLIVGLASASVLITVIQEARSERVLEALRDLTSPRALVIRDGRRQRIAGRDVVRGDVVVLAEGDRIPADAVLLSGQVFETDESLLTGESVPVRKRASNDGAIEPVAPGGEESPFVFAGTLVVRGQSIAEVIATGARSEIGKIGKTLEGIEREAPRLARQTNRLAKGLAIIGLGVSALFTVLDGALRGAWLEALLGGVALSMSLLPEELPLVLTVFLVMGAWRITKAGVLTRRASAIESLGSATVLCTDKTGTLTENRMTIVELRVGEAVVDLRGDAGPPGDAPTGRMIRIGRLACPPDPFDPMEKAFHVLAGQHLAADAAMDGGDLVRDYPFGSDVLAMSNVWRQADGSLLVATKGAPEAVADLCRLDPVRRAALRQATDDMAARGMRVLGIAQAVRPAEPLPASQRELALEFLGLVGLSDPLRATVPRAVGECRSAGIRVVMITGDYPATARAIADEAGIETGAILSGDDLARMTDDALVAQVGRVNVFARIRPDQKLRIVRALRRRGDVVAMTGDGVNDAPALKAADIGIAMGGRGSDVAREASAIVLLRDDFGSIVQTIRLGRRIYDNIHKAMGFVMAIHVPIAGLAILPLLSGLPLILMPVHIAFLEIIIDPICSIAFEAEPEERDLMTRRPRDPGAALFSPALIAWSLVQGAAVLLAAAAILFLCVGRGMPEGEARALVLVTLVLGDITLILINRSFSTSLVRAFLRPNRTLLLILGVDIGLLALILLLPPLRGLFRLGTVAPQDLAYCVLANAVVLATMEFFKRFWRTALRT